jgi:hypothetical protein
MTKRLKAKTIINKVKRGLSNTATMGNPLIYDMEESVKKHLKGSKEISAEALTGIMKDSSTSFESKFNELLEAVRDMSSKLDDFKEDITVKITKSESRIDRIESLLDKHIKDARAHEKKIDAAIATMQFKLKNMQNLHIDHYLELNTREQRSRCWSVRGSYWLDLSDPEDPSPFKVYVKIIRPALEAALADGRIDWLPNNYSRIVEYAHGLPGKKDSPPSFLFRFHSRAQLFAFQAYKKPFVDALNAENARRQPSLAQAISNGSRRQVKFGADLTTLNRNLMTFLHGQKGVSGVKLAGTRVMFSRTGIKGWTQACNPYGRTLEKN